MLVKYLAENLPGLECVHLNFRKAFGDPAEVDPEFLGKIKSVRLLYSSDFVYLLQAPAFQPECVEISDSFGQDDWELLSTMTSLRKLVVGDEFRSSYLLEAALPPNLGTLELKALILDARNDGSLAALRKILQTRDVSKWKLQELPLFKDIIEWSRAQHRLYDRKMRVWQDEVPGFARWEPVL